MTTEAIEKVNRRHIGRNVQKIRTYLGVKQKALALDLGISQTKVWKIESKEKIEEGLLSRIAGILSVSPEVIREFDEKRAINNINNQCRLVKLQLLLIHVINFLWFMISGISPARSYDFTSLHHHLVKSF